MAISFTIERTIDADPDTVFGILTDHRGMADITPLRRSTLDREGSPEPDGVGAVRRLALVGPPLVEEVTRYERPTRFGYRLRSGLPVRDHVGDVVLVPDGGRTRLSYRVDSTPTIKGTGKALELILRQAIATMVAGVQKAAERRD